MRRGAVTARRYESEAHLCEVFAEAAGAAGLEVYPEVDEWDLLLVRRLDPELVATSPVPVRPAIQIGVEAKLRVSLDAVAQAHDRMARRERPDAAAVLVPEVSQALAAVCRGLGLAAWCPASWRKRDLFALPVPPGFAGDHAQLPLPRYDVPHLVAGAPSPRPLTRWRERAIRLCIRLRERGCVTSLDFRELGLSKRWWIGPDGCLVQSGSVGRHARYAARAGAKLPDVGWEAVAEQIRAQGTERDAA